MMSHFTTDNATEKTTSSRSRLRQLTTCGLVLLAGFFFWKALPEDVRNDASESLAAPAAADAPLPASANGILTQPIETIRVGQRVLARNPEISDSERQAWGEEPDFSRWVYLKLLMPAEDGSVLKIDLIRPQEWVNSQLGYVVEETDVGRTNEQREADPAITPSIDHTAGSSLRSARPASLVPLSPLRPVFFNIVAASAAIEQSGQQLAGLTVELNLPEMGAYGTAVITDILPSPVIEPKTGPYDSRQVVTATFRHPPSNEVLDVSFISEHEWVRKAKGGRRKDDSGKAEEDLNGTEQESGVSATSSVSLPLSSVPVGVTDNHLFWSADRQRFVPIGELEIGERVVTYHGEFKRIASKLPRPGPVSEVYNLEVYGEHVYFIGHDALLAHNAYSDFRASVGKLASRNSKNTQKMKYAYYQLLRKGKIKEYRAYMKREFGIEGGNLRSTTLAGKRAGHGNSSTSTGAQEGYYIEAFAGPHKGTRFKVGVVEAAKGMAARFREQVDNVVELATKRGLKGVKAEHLKPVRAKSIPAGPNARARIYEWEAKSAKWHRANGHDLPGHRKP